MSDAVRKKRMQLTEKDAATLEKYLKTDYSDIERQQMLDMGKVDGGYDLGKSLAGQGAFRDTGRESSGVGEAWDSIVGVPYRTAIDELQTADLSLENNPMKRVAKSLARVGSSVGTDPQNAPQAFDLAARATDNPYLGAGLATAIEVATPGTIPMPGVVGKVGKLPKILDEVNTAEKAVALKGAEREQYLKALDEAFGDRVKRAAKSGKNLERIKERAATDKFLAEQDIEPVTTRKGGSSFIELQDKNGNSVRDIVLHPPTGGMNSAGLPEELRGRGVYQKILEDNAMKGYATGSDDAQRSMDADKVWNRIAKQKGAVKRGTYEDLGIDNPANPYGEVTVLNNDVLKNSLNRVPEAAFDPRFADSPLLLAGKAGAAPSREALAIEKAINDRRVPYKVSARDGELSLKSPKAKASASFRDLDSIDEMDPEMTAYLEKIGAQNPIYLEHLAAEKGFGAKALSQIEASAKKRGADAAYLNASPVGGARGLSQEEAAAKLREFYKKNGYEVAKDFGTNTMMYKKLLGEAGMAPGREALAIEKAINDRRKKRAK